MPDVNEAILAYKELNRLLEFYGCLNVMTALPQLLMDIAQAADKTPTTVLAELQIIAETYFKRSAH